MASLASQIKTWLVVEDFDEFLSLIPRGWAVEEIERWNHCGDRPGFTGTRLAVSFEIYAETWEEVERFWGWFNDYLKGSPDENAREREYKWKRVAGAYQL